MWETSPDVDIKVWRPLPQITAHACPRESGEMSPLQVFHNLTVSLKSRDVARDLQDKAVGHQHHITLMGSYRDEFVRARRLERRLNGNSA